MRRKERAPSVRCSFPPLRKGERAVPMSAAAKPDEKAAEVADKEKPVENIDALEVR